MIGSQRTWPSQQSPVYQPIPTGHPHPGEGERGKDDRAGRQRHQVRISGRIGGGSSNHICGRPRALLGNGREAGGNFIDHTRRPCFVDLNELGDQSRVDKACRDEVGNER